MPKTLRVHFLPALTTADELAGRAVVVADILRASTTINAALAAGAKAVIPALEVGEARQKAASGALLGGERGGLPIEGFDLGNSPSEYTPERVAGKTVVFTTTNGTQALRICGQAAQVYIGAFVNVSAVARAVRTDQHVHVLCAGTRGHITREDVMFAGALVERLTAETAPEPGQFDATPRESAALHEGVMNPEVGSAAASAPELNDEARIALDVWRRAMGDTRWTDPVARRQLAAALRSTQGGMNLTSIGLERDIPDAADIDRYNLVPNYDATTGRITAVNDS